MMRWGDVYEVVEELSPLLFALILGFGSVKWWEIFSKEEERNAINKFVCNLCLPLITFHFTSKINPFHLNLHFFAADAISKLLIFGCLALCEFYFTKGTYHGSLATFSHSSLANSLIIGAPIANAIYGQRGVDLIVQGSVIQALVWQMVLLFVQEVHHTSAWLLLVKRLDDQMVRIVQDFIAIMSKMGIAGAAILGIFMVVQRRWLAHEATHRQTIIGMWLTCIFAGPATAVVAIVSFDCMNHRGYTPLLAILPYSVIQASFWPLVLVVVVELWWIWSYFSVVVEDSSFNGSDRKAQKMGKDLKEVAMEVNRPLFRPLMKKVLLKLAKNPNSYSCIIGFAWAILVKRWDIEMLDVVENCIGMMLKMGIGAALFNMGMVVAMQERLIACGSRQAIIGMVLKFIAGPATMAIVSIAMGLRGQVLCLPILQAAIQQPITLSIHAKEHQLHTQLLSTNAKTQQFQQNFVRAPSCDKMGSKKDN